MLLISQRLQKSIHTGSALEWGWQETWRKTPCRFNTTFTQWALSCFHNRGYRRHMPYLLHVAAIQFNTAPVPHLLWRTQTAIANVRSNLLSSRMVFILLNECAYIFPSSNMLFSAFFFFFFPLSNTNDQSFKRHWRWKGSCSLMLHYHVYAAALWCVTTVTLWVLGWRGIARELLFCCMQPWHLEISLRGGWGCVRWRSASSWTEPAVRWEVAQTGKPGSWQQTATTRTRFSIIRCV